MQNYLARLTSFGMRVSRAINQTIWFPILLLTAIALAVNWRLLLNESGCVIWGNYILPCTQHQYSIYQGQLSTWNPYTFMGSPVAVTFPYVLEQLVGIVPLASLSYVLGPAQAAAWYAVLSTIFLGWTFLNFSKSFVRNYWGQLAGAVLIVVGPFQLQLYGNGDYSAMIAEGFVFLSIYFLWRAIDHPTTRWVSYPCSLALLVFSFVLPQIFLLGLVLYIASLVAFCCVLKTGSLRDRLIFLGKTSARLLALPLLLTPLLLPALFASPINLGPSSAYANPLNVFTGFSANPISVFFTLGYVWSPGTSLTNYQGYVMVSSASNSIVANAWLVLTIGLVAVTWVGVLVLRDHRGYYLFGLSVLVSLLGSGTLGPLGGLNEYLYLHLTGYQELNASYFWDWMVVVPALALALGILVERLIESRSGGERGGSAAESSSGGIPIATSAPKWHLSRTGRDRILRATSVMLGLIVIASVALPYAISAQNGPVRGEPIGIQAVPYPSDYSKIPTLLSDLVGSEYAGVAVFNPTIQWLMQNSTTIVQNYFFNYPTVREPTIPGYDIPPYASNFYSYWVYQELYTNATRYVGQLLSVMGIEFLLVFYGTQPVPSYTLPYSVGQNASRLLEYQVGILPVVTDKDFAIYKNLYYSNTAVSLSNLSIVAGGYSELNAMAYAGVNLTNQGGVFPSDIPAGGCGEYMSRVSRIYAESANALKGLALACAANSSSDPIASIQGDNTIGTGWSSSYSALSGALGLSVVDSWPTPLAVTSGGPHSIDVSVDVGNCSACSLWVPVRLWSDGGLLQFQWNGVSWELSTDQAWDGYNNTMVWVQLPFQHLGEDGVLRVTSVSGVNAFGTIYVASESSITTWLQSELASKSVILTEPGLILTPPLARPGTEVSKYCGVPIVTALDGTSVCLEESGSLPLTLNITLPDREPGWLSLLVRSYSSVDLTLGQGSPRLFGFNASNNDWSNFSMAWVRIPVTSSEIGGNDTLALQVENGEVFLSEVVYSPLSTFSPLVPSVPEASFSVTSTRLTSSVSYFNLSITRPGSGEDELAGSVQYGSTANDQYLGTVTLNGTPSNRYDLAIQYAVSPGLVLSFDGIRFGGLGTEGFSEFESALLFDRGPSTLSTSNLTFYAVGFNPSGNTNATFSVQLEPISFALESNVTDVGPNPDWTVSLGSAGYQLTGGPASLVLVRVPFFTDLEFAQSGFALSSAYGGIDSVISGSSNGTHFTVYPTSNRLADVGYAVLGGTIATWIVVEYAWLRLRRTRRSDPNRTTTSEADRSG